MNLTGSQSYNFKDFSGPYYDNDLVETETPQQIGHAETNVIEAPKLQQKSLQDIFSEKNNFDTKLLQSLQEQLTEEEKLEGMKRDRQMTGFQSQPHPPVNFPASNGRQENSPILDDPQKLFSLGQFDSPQENLHGLNNFLYPHQWNFSTAEHTPSNFPLQSSNLFRAGNNNMYNKNQPFPESKHMAYNVPQNIPVSSEIQNKIPPSIFRCSVCRKVFSTRSSLQKHAQTHSTIRPFQCKKCSASFKNKHDVVRHNRVHSGAKPFYCNICFKFFQEQSALKPHKTIHDEVKPFKCSLCSRFFRQKIALKIHMDSHLKGKLKNLSKEQLDKIATKRQAYSDYHSNIDSKGSSKIRCWLCNIYFNSQKDLKQHSVIHRGVMPFGCALCLEAFKTSSALRAHERDHLATYSHICSICHMCFSNHSDLEMHMFRHKMAL